MRRHRRRDAGRAVVRHSPGNSIALDAVLAHIAGTGGVDEHWVLADLEALLEGLNHPGRGWRIRHHRRGVS